jgi:quinol monooxygenase YgiN
MMMALTILAKITANEGQERRLRAALQDLVAPTRAEPGCLQYDLHVDNSSSGVFMFYETWQTREMWQAHMETPHLAAFRVASDGAIAQFELNEMTKIG